MDINETPFPCESQKRIVPDTKRTVSGDEESWVKSRIESAINMVLAIEARRQVEADNAVFQYGFDGIVEGTAVEIINILGLRPSYTNIRSKKNRQNPNR